MSKDLGMLQGQGRDSVPCSLPKMAIGVRRDFDNISIAIHDPETQEDGGGRQRSSALIVCVRYEG